MKKTVVYIVLCVLILLVHGNSNISYAVDDAQVSAAYEAIEQVSENVYIIPIYIVNNPGIMGFRIDINYNPETVRIDTISKGKITSDGNFNTNESISVASGSISIWWNSTDNVHGDGSIMYITATMIGMDSDSLDLDISYSQDDTFDSEWKDVVLDCYSVSYPVNTKSEDITDVDMEPVNTTTDDNTEPSELASPGEGIEVGKDEDDFEKDITGIQDNSYKDYKSGVVPEKLIKDETEKMFLNSAKITANSESGLDEIGISEDKLRRAIARRMKEYNIRDVQELDENQRYDFCNSLNDDLIKIEGVDEKKLADIDIDKLAETVVVTQEDIESATLPIESEAKNNTKKEIIIWIEAAAIIVIFAVILVIRRRRK